MIAQERLQQNGASTGLAVAPTRRDTRDIVNRKEIPGDVKGSRRPSVQGLLQVDDLTVCYRSQDGRQLVALEAVSFEIAAGEALGLLGESGCGKTTLGLALLGLLPAAGSVMRGSAMFRGKNLLTMGERDLQEVRGAAISMVHQEPGAALNPVLRIGEQVTEVIRAHRQLSSEHAREEASLLLTQVGLPQEACIAAAYPHQLSGGQLQRVAFAQAIACRPALVIADEPTTALDKATQLDILGLLTGLRKKLRLALLLITHDSSVLAQAADRILVIREGRIVEQGTTKEVIGKSLDPYTQALLRSRPVIDWGKDHRLTLTPTPDKAPDHTSCCAPIRFDEASRADRAPETLLHAVNLGKRYVQGRWLTPRRHQIQALYGVELKLLAGSTLALIGASGSGKSTLARCLACLESPDSGEIWFGGTNVLALSDRELIPFRRQIQMIFQDPSSSLNPRFTAVQIVSEPLLTARRGTEEACRDRALALMELVGLRADWGKQLPHQFSAGQRRRLAIARAISLEPKLLILDEALAGLDLPIQTQISDLLLELQGTLSLSYIYISHDLDLIARVADRVVVLHWGQIVETVTTRELFVKPQSVPACNLVRANLEIAGFPGGLT